MIIVAGTVLIDPAKKDDALKIMKTMMEATQQEAGCISYRFFANPWDDAEILVFEEWETQDALTAHFHTAHMATFREHLPNYVTRPSVITRYVVSEHGPLG